MDDSGGQATSGSFLSTILRSSPIDGGEDGLYGRVEGGLLPRHDVRVGEDGGDDDDGEGVGGQHVDGEAPDRVERRQAAQGVVRREPEDGLKSSTYVRG